MFLPLFTELFQFCVEVTPTPPWLQIYGPSHCQAIFAHLIIIGNNISLTAIFIVKIAAMTSPMTNCDGCCIQKFGILCALTLITVWKKGSMYNHQNILTTAPPQPLSGEFFLAKEEHVFNTIEVHPKRKNIFHLWLNLPMHTSTHCSDTMCSFGQWHDSDQLPSRLVKSRGWVQLRQWHKATDLLTLV